MAIEKTLNTRIILKNDTLAALNASSFIPKKGEMLLASVDSYDVNGVVVPTYLIKVGDGKSTFANLKYAAAQAADVYAWAKQSSLFIETEGVGNAVTDVAWDASLNDGKGGLKITTSDMATKSDFDDLKVIVDKLNGADTTEGSVAYALKEAKAYAEEKATAAANGKDAAIKAAQDAADAAQDDVDTLEDYVGTFTPVGAETTVIGYIDAKHNAQQTVINGMINEGTGILAQAKKYTDDEVKELSDGQVTTNKNDIAAIKEDIGTVDNLETTNKDITGAINELKAAIGTGGTAAVVTLTEIAPKPGYAKTYSLKQGETSVGTIDIPKDMVVQSGTVETKVEAGAWGEAGTYIHLILANATNDDIYINVGTLVDIYKPKANAAQVQVAIDSSTREISATIVDGSVDADALATDAVTTAKIADKNVTMAKLSTEVAGAVQTVIQNSGTWNSAEQNAKDYADSLAGNYATAAQGAKADSAVQTFNTAMVSEYINITGSPIAMVSVTDKLKNGIAAAETAIQSIRVMNPTSDFVSISVDEGVVDAGASETNPNIIATASMRLQTAVGYAETALQEIEAGTGLTVSTKANGKQTIGIDEAVTFIFDCGGAEV